MVIDIPSLPDITISLGRPVWLGNTPPFILRMPLKWSENPKDAPAMAYQIQNAMNWGSHEEQRSSEVGIIICLTWGSWWRCQGRCLQCTWGHIEPYKRHDNPNILPLPSRTARPASMPITSLTRTECPHRSCRKSNEQRRTPSDFDEPCWRWHAADGSIPHILRILYIQ